MSKLDMVNMYHEKYANNENLHTSLKSLTHLSNKSDFIDLSFTKNKKEFDSLCCIRIALNNAGKAFQQFGTITIFYNFTNAVVEFNHIIRDVFSNHNKKPTRSKNDIKNASAGNVRAALPTNCPNQATKYPNGVFQSNGNL